MLEKHCKRNFCTPDLFPLALVTRRVYQGDHDRTDQCYLNRRHSHQRQYPEYPEYQRMRTLLTEPGILRPLRCTVRCGRRSRKREARDSGEDSSSQVLLPWLYEEEGTVIMG